MIIAYYDILSTYYLDKLVNKCIIFGTMRPAHTFDELYQQIKLRKVPFLVVFFGIVFITYAFLYAIDFVPEPVTTPTETKEEVIPEEEAPQVVAQTPPVKVVESPLPVRVIFDSLNREVPVLNPVSRDIAVLDEALLSGVVRHPDSADFSEDGNILILGHSSYLPNVFNKNFQAFNGIQSLTWGDVVRVQSEDTEYVYRVQDTYKAKASEVVVPNTPGEARLTLATCNSFGSKDDRFVVEAVLIDTVAL